LCAGGSHPRLDIGSPPQPETHRNSKAMQAYCKQIPNATNHLWYTYASRLIPAHITEHP
jgi:hypothetical protein